MADDVDTMPELNDTLRKAGWVEVGEGAGVWRSPDDADDPAGQKWTSFGAAVEELRRNLAKPKKATARKK